MIPTFGRAQPRTIERFGAADSEPRENHIETAWAVLDAANDLGDDATVDICRRVIDASLYRAPVSPSDLQIILKYFS